MKFKKEKLIGFMLAFLFVVAFAFTINLGMVKNVEASIRPECTCAERINWLGACRGATTSLCKGASTCGCG